jgi:hypothetical protein
MTNVWAVLLIAAFATACGVVVRKDLSAEIAAAVGPGVEVHDARQTVGITLRGLSPYSDRIETTPSVADAVAAALSTALGALPSGDRIDASVTTAMCIVKNELVIGYADFSLEVDARITRKGTARGRTLSVSRAGEKVGAGFAGVDFETLCTQHFKVALQTLGQQAQQAYLDTSPWTSVR